MGDVAERNPLCAVLLEGELSAVFNDLETESNVELVDYLNVVSVPRKDMLSEDVVVNAVNTEGVVNVQVRRNSTVDVTFVFETSDESESERNVGVRALIDSGAAGNFMSQRFVEEYGIATRRKEKSITAVLADKASCVVIGFETVEIKMFIGGHVECICFDVMPTLSYSVILGVPWLLRHNPWISWSAGIMCFSNCACDATGSRLLNPLMSPSMLGCSAVIKFGEVMDDCDVFESCDSVVVDVDLPLAYRDFVDVFSAVKADMLPEHRPYDCAITLKQPDCVPPFSPIYSLSEQDRISLKEYIDENLKKGFIRKSSSPAGAGVFFVPKKDGAKRLCVDYRGLNELTVRNSFPMPLIADLLDRVRRAKVFSKIDLRGAYNLVRIKPGDEWKTAFRCMYGHFEYLVMPFGLTNAPAVFQSMMVDIFRDILDVFVVVYLDDLLIFSEDFDSHVAHVREVLSRLREFKLYAKASKCVFHADSVEFLGFVVSAGGVRMAEDKVAAIKDWPVPRRVKDVQSFLGFCNFYRRFIKSFSENSRVLSDLTKKDVAWNWTPECQAAFEKLKSSILNAPSVHHPNFDLPFVLETDASDFAVGAVLSQPVDLDHLDDLRPVGFYSRKLLPAEVNYDIHDKELLAILCALDHWSHYLLGSPFKIRVYSDHRNLVYFRSRRTLSPRLLRWSAVLNQFDFVIVYQRGDVNVGADALSRRVDFSDGKESRETKDVVECLLPEKFWSLNAVSVSAPTKHKVKEVSDVIEQFEIIKARHNSVFAGHSGRHRTFELVARDFSWPGMRKQIYDFVDSCAICQKVKVSRQKAGGLLKPLEIASRPWSDISMDFIVGLPVSNGFDSILVVVDRFSKMSHFFAVNESINASTLARLLMDQVVKLHGIPESIVSDRGPQFNSLFWKECWSLLGCRINLSTAAHPQSDGQTERANQTLEHYLRCFVNYHQDNWSSFLSFAEFALNNLVSSSTGVSPFFANYGFNPRMDDFSLKESKVQKLSDWLTDIKSIHVSVGLALHEASGRMKYYADSKRREVVFKVGNLVWLSTSNLKSTRPSKKLDYRRIGPFEIVEKINDAAYKLKLPQSMRIHPVFHVSLLTAFVKPNAYQEPVNPDAVVVEGELEFEVEEILASRKGKAGTEFLVRWKGFGDFENSWEPIENVLNCWDLVEFYRKFSPNVHRPPTDELRRLGKFLPLFIKRDVMSRIP